MKPYALCTNTLHLAAFGAALLSATYGQAASDAVDMERVVELPRLVVSDSRLLPQPESWLHGSLPGVEILSSASDRETQLLIRDLTQFRDAVRVVWPVPEKAEAPLMLILCGSKVDFDSFMPAQARDGFTRPVSTLLKGDNRSAIVIDMAAKTISTTGTETEFGVMSDKENIGLIAIEQHKQLRRQFARYLLSRSEPRLPAWCEEGMIQIVTGMTIEPGFIEVGRIQPANTISAQAETAATFANVSAEGGPGDHVGIQSVAQEGDSSAGAGSHDLFAAEDHDFNYVLANIPLLSFTELFAPGHDSPQALNPYRYLTWSKQSCAFVHLGLYGDGGKWQKPFAKFLARSSREPVTEAMFQECFGKDYAGMAAVLREYIAFTNYESKQYRAKGNTVVVQEPVQLRNATQSEVGWIKGSALQLSGRSDAALQQFIAPYARGERDPKILAALGLSEREAGRHDRARKLLTAAVEGKTTEAAAYLELARYRYADAVAAPAGSQGRFSAEQRAGIVSLLLAARSLPPQNPELFELLADTWLRSDANPTEPDVAPLMIAVNYFPTRLKLVYATAALSGRAGMKDAQRTLVAHGVKYSPNAAAKSKFEALLQP